MTDVLPTDQLAQLHRLHDTHEVVDALYRFAAGQDHRDPALFLSAFAPGRPCPPSSPRSTSTGPIRTATCCSRTCTTSRWSVTATPS